jgi:predicted O-methyltransferase YrrM
LAEDPPRTPPKQEVVERLVAERPAFHSLEGEEQVWHASPATLGFIGATVEDGARTVETGAGASTVVFAAAGARHTAISPESYEHRLISRYCESLGVPTDRLEFVTAFAEEVLPSRSSQGALDFAFIDGKHSFPHPILDWHYLGRRLRVGGTMLLDDVAALAVQMLFRVMLADDAWRLTATLDGEAAAFEKLAEAPPGDPWLDQKIAPATELERHFGFSPSA